MKPEKLFIKLRNGQTKNVKFTDLVKLVESFDFSLVRVSGSHHIFMHSNGPYMINLHNVSGEAKPYQIRQFLKLVEEHHLTML